MLDDQVQGSNSPFTRWYPPRHQNYVRIYERCNIGRLKLYQHYLNRCKLSELTANTVVIKVDHLQLYMRSCVYCAALQGLKSLQLLLPPAPDRLTVVPST